MSLRGMQFAVAATLRAQSAILAGAKTTGGSDTPVNPRTQARTAIFFMYTPFGPYATLRTAAGAGRSLNTASIPRPGC
jgi:hypothetical protein